MPIASESGGFGSSVSATDTVRRSFSLRSFNSTDFQFETNLVHVFDWLDSSWKVLGGFDVRRTELDHSGPGFGNIANFDFVNVLNPMDNVPLLGPNDPAISKFDRTEQTTEARDAYVQAEGWFFEERLKLVAGPVSSPVSSGWSQPSCPPSSPSPDSESGGGSTAPAVGCQCPARQSSDDHYLAETRPENQG